MKSERRHELQHNELADALEHWTVRIKPYGRAIAGAIVLLLVAAFAMAYVSGKNQAKSEAAWDEYFEAMNTGDRVKLTELAERYAGSPVAPWARSVAADLELGEGCQQLFNQKAEGRDLVQQAVDNFRTVMNDTSSEELKQRALFGLARGHEALGALSDLKKAREEYQQLVDQYPDGVYSTAAKSRLADLERGSTKQFYDWFVKYEPPRAGAGVGKKLPFDEESLDKGMKLPSALDSFNPGGETKKEPSATDEFKLLPDDKPLGVPSDAPPAESPVVPSETPATETPATETPATESPAPDAAPAETPAETPAPETPAEPAPSESK